MQDSSKLPGGRRVSGQERTSRAMRQWPTGHPRGDHSSASRQATSTRRQRVAVSAGAGKGPLSFLLGQMCCTRAGTLTSRRLTMPSFFETAIIAAQ